MVGAAQLAQVLDRGTPRRGPEQGELDLLSDGALAIRNGLIVAVGATEQILDEYTEDGVTTIDAQGKTVLPGLVECHSHPLFAGDRFEEFEQRMRGATIEEVARAGGGIGKSVVHTRASTENELLENAARAYARIIAGGVTTLEVKSGYGLTVEDELNHLALLDRSRTSTELDLIISFLGAHVVPPESTSSDDYVAMVLDEMLPEMVKQGIASFHDVTCEQGLFSPRQAAQMLARSRKMGIPTRVHADAWLPSEGWRTAVAGGAVSAEHLTFTPDDEISEVGRTDTIAVLLPAAELVYMCSERANARLFIENEVPIAIATDFCSSIRATSLLRTVGMASPWFGITAGEAIVGATINAAYSLGLRDRGSLQVGKRGDLIVIDAKHPGELPLALGDIDVSLVVVAGNVVDVAPQPHVSAPR